MGLYQASFRVKHECPYRTVSERYPDLTIREWFMNEHQILEVAAPTAPSEELTAAIDDLGTVLYEASSETNLYVVVRSCLCSLDDSLISRFEARNCLYMPPTIYQQGWEHYTVTAFDDGDVRRLLRDLDADRDIEVLSTKEIETTRVPHSLFTTLDTLFDGLTARQLEALRIALDNGYFEQPRGSSIEALAGRTNVSRSTYEEHLRKAENKLLTNTENLVRLITEKNDFGRLLEPRSPAVSP